MSFRTEHYLHMRLLFDRSYLLFAKVFIWVIRMAVVFIILIRTSFDGIGVGVSTLVSYTLVALKFEVPLKPPLS